MLLALEELLRPDGLVVLLVGRGSVTIGAPEAAPRERLELRGPHVAASFTGPEALVGPDNLPALRAEQATVLATQPGRLRDGWVACARSTREHLGQGMCSESEPLDALLATIAAAGRTSKRGEVIAPGAMSLLRIPSRHHGLAMTSDTGPLSSRSGGAG